MLFWEVKPEYDGTIVTKTDRKGQQTVRRSLIGNELYTDKELKRLMNSAALWGNRVKDDTIIFDGVDIKKGNTFWSFGVRFKCKEA